MMCLLAAGGASSASPGIPHPTGLPLTSATQMAQAAVAQAEAATAALAPAPSAAPKRRKNSKAVQADAVIEAPSGAAAAASLDAVQQRLSEADAATAAAQAEAVAAQQRVFEIRAEAALLVETVEDRAHEVSEWGGRWGVAGGQGVRALWWVGGRPQAGRQGSVA